MLHRGDVASQSIGRSALQNSITRVGGEQAPPSIRMNGRAAVDAIDLTLTDDEDEEEEDLPPLAPAPKPSSRPTTAVRADIGLPCAIDLASCPDDLLVTSRQLPALNGPNSSCANKIRQEVTSRNGRSLFHNPSAVVSMLAGSSSLPKRSSLEHNTSNLPKKSAPMLVEAFTSVMEASFSSSSSFLSSKSGSRSSTPATSILDGEEKIIESPQVVGRSQSATLASPKGKERASESAELDSEDEYIGPSKRSSKHKTAPKPSSALPSKDTHKRRHPLVSDNSGSTVLRQCTCEDTLCPGRSNFAHCTAYPPSPPKSLSPPASRPVPSTSTETLATRSAKFDLVDRAPPRPPPLPSKMLSPLHFVLIPEVREGEMTAHNIYELQQEIRMINFPNEILESAKYLTSTSLSRLTATPSRMRLTDMPGVQRTSKRQRLREQRRRSSSRSAGRKSRSPRDAGAATADGSEHSTESEDSDSDSDMEESEAEKCEDADSKDLTRQTRACGLISAEEPDEIVFARKRKLPCLEDETPDTWGGEDAGYLASELLEYELPGGGRVGKKVRPRSTGADVSAMRYGLFEEVMEEFAAPAPAKNKKRKSTRSASHEEQDHQP